MNQITAFLVLLPCSKAFKCHRQVFNSWPSWQWACPLWVLQRDPRLPYTYLRAIAVVWGHHAATSLLFLPVPLTRMPPAPAELPKSHQPMRLVALLLLLEAFSDHPRNDVPWAPKLPWFPGQPFCFPTSIQSPNQTEFLDLPWISLPFSFHVSANISEPVQNRAMGPAAGWPDVLPCENSNVILLFSSLTSSGDAQAMKMERRLTWAPLWGYFWESFAQNDKRGLGLGEPDRFAPFCDFII